MASWRFDGALKAYGMVRWHDRDGVYASFITLCRGGDGWLLFEGVSDKPRVAGELPERWDEIVLRRSTPDEILREIRAGGFMVRRMTDAEAEEQSEDGW